MYILHGRFSPVKLLHLFDQSSMTDFAHVVYLAQSTVHKQHSRWLVQKLCVRFHGSLFLPGCSNV